MSEEIKKKKVNTENTTAPASDKAVNTDRSTDNDTARGVTVTSDDKNASSAHAMPNSGRSADVADPDMDDDILAVIRRRKAAEEKKTRALEIAKISGIADAEVDDFFAMEGLDRELSAPEKKGADTKVVDRATFNESIRNAEKDQKRTITIDKTADTDLKDSKEKAPSEKEPENSSDPEVDISNYFYPEKKPEDKASDTVKQTDQASETEKDTDALLQELINEEIAAKNTEEGAEGEADNKETDSSEDEKRYGFKPYGFCTK